ncbi:MAG: patatin-like phospholipase family protein [Bacteroidia bacterium]|nr:patatin-like phospholipase family protein [Bacteroidia bacterium]
MAKTNPTTPKSTTQPAAPKTIAITPRTQRAGTKGLDVALQGGGAHGAFTWGVLDYFLEQEKDIHLDGICGTSAGAMNSVIMAYGLMQGGNERARELLTEFWSRISKTGDQFPMFKPTPMDKLFGNGNLDYSPFYKWMEMMMQFSSPYHWNPFDINPLRDLLLDMVDFDTLRSCKQTQLFVCATNVLKGRLRVFSLKDLTVDAVLASACLPFIYKAIVIDGEPYWDGGYMGNPPLFPLIDNTPTGDILIVQINPINIDETPTEAADIHDRINEISFNSSLMLELRKVRFIDKLQNLGVDLSPAGHFKRIRLHLINPGPTIAKLNISSKLNTDWDFLTHLRDTGRAHAKDWLDKNYDFIGVKPTCDVDADYLR